MTIAKCNSLVKLKSFFGYIGRCALFNVKLHFFNYVSSFKVFAYGCTMLLQGPLAALKINIII